MIINYNTYIKESKDDITPDFVVNRLSSKLFSSIKEICKIHFNNLNSINRNVANSGIIEKVLILNIKNKLLFYINISINKSFSIDVTIYNNMLDFRYNKYYNGENCITFDNYIEEIYYEVIQDFKRYFSQIDQTLIDMDYYIDNKKYDKLDKDKINSLVFRKYNQNLYDEFILKYIELDNKNIINLDIELCSDYVKDKIEHLKNASNFDLI